MSSTGSKSYCHHEETAMNRNKKDGLRGFINNDFINIFREMRLSYLPPLMVYFAVMAAFTNLALSASQLATKYVNQIYTVERGNYDELGILMISVTLVSLIVPLLSVRLLAPKPGEGR
jgi:hypothetical protein